MRWHLMKQTIWRCLLLAGLLAGCEAPEDKRPDGLIPEDRMAQILTEIHLTESTVSRLNLVGVDSANMAYKHLERQVFRKFQVDTAAYTRSYIYYSSHPREMEAIYKQVVEKLQVKNKIQKPPHA